MGKGHLCLCSCAAKYQQGPFWKHGVAVCVDHHLPRGAATLYENLINKPVGKGRPQMVWFWKVQHVPTSDKKSAVFRFGKLCLCAIFAFIMPHFGQQILYMLADNCFFEWCMCFA